jgi:hypothetical protein
MESLRGRFRVPKSHFARGLILQKPFLSSRTAITAIVLVISVLSITYPLGFSTAVVHGTRPRVPGLRAGTSLNWSGYAVTAATGSVTDVKASWVVPAVTCSSTNTVEQTGTDSDCQNGNPTYYAWYEFYPQPSFIITGLAIHVGDIISAEVSSSGKSFTVTLNDLTSGGSYSSSANVASAKRSSAEWIAEAPSSGGSILPLSDFSTASFGLDNTGVGSTNYATISGTTGPIGSFGSSVQEITMVSSSGGTEAQPSALSTDGTSFSVAWVGSSTTTTTSSSSTVSNGASLTVAVSMNQASYSQNSWAYITVTVTNSATGTPVSGASVTITVTAPNGASSSGSGTANSNGSVTFKFRISPNATLGTYSVSALASAAGYNSGSGTTTFVVN